MRRLGTLAAAITLLTAAPASAETFTVNTNVDAAGTCASTCTIRGALASAAANGPTTEDLIIVPANTYQLGSELTVDSRVIIRGAGARTTAIRGNRPASGAPWRVFDIAAVQATIESLTMENGGVIGENGGNLRNTGDTVLLDHVRVTNGLAPNGGGIANEIGSMTIRNSLVDTNQGGGIFSLGGNAPSSVIVHDSTIALNTIGPGIELAQAGQPSTGRLERVTVARNSSGSDPGGIALGAPGAMSARASIIAANTGDSGGDVNCSDPLASGGGNIESDADCGLSAATGDLPSTNAALSANLENPGGRPTCSPSQRAAQRYVLAHAPAPTSGICLGRRGDRVTPGHMRWIRLPIRPLWRPRRRSRSPPASRAFRSSAVSIGRTGPGRSPRVRRPRTTRVCGRAATSSSSGPSTRAARPIRRRQWRASSSSLRRPRASSWSSRSFVGGCA